MARQTKPLTNTEIKQSKPKAKEYSLSDGGGLALRVMPSGSKLWIFNYYQPFTKKRKNISFGVYPDVSLASARKMRQAAREQLANDVDPKHFKDEVQRQKAAELNATFGALAKEWITLKEKTVAPTTAKKSWQLMDKHVLPFIGSFPVSHLKPADVINVIRPISNRGNHETVKRLCRHVNEIMRHALAGGLIEANYLADITKLFPAPQKKHMATLPPAKLPDLMKSLANASVSLNTRYLIEWQLHTMARPIEAASAKWCDIRFDEQLWVIPAHQMKMKREHVIPLSKQALALLTNLKVINGHRPYIFPGHRDPKSHLNSSTANVALKRMGFKGQLVSHGLRALASTTLNEQGFDPDVIESALAHIDKNATRRAYNRAEYLEQRRVMMQWWSDHIEAAAHGNMSLANSKRTLSVVTA